MEEDFDYQKYANVIQLKDNGYSWVVLGAMVVSNALTAGYIKSFGIIYNSVLDEFPDTSGSEAGLMMGLLVACRTTLAPFTCAMGIKFGSRISIMLGAILCFVGLILSYFCKSVWQLSLTLGGMMVYLY
ncbi:Monocarboxylate transporter 7 [Armadillidium vulgare]|nr:Monocarboxylate transporter 7 [Armadillidium vulgare]